ARRGRAGGPPRGGGGGRPPRRGGAAPPMDPPPAPAVRGCRSRACRGRLPGPTRCRGCRPAEGQRCNRSAPPRRSSARRRNHPAAVAARPTGRRPPGRGPAGTGAPGPAARPAPEPLLAAGAEIGGATPDHDSLDLGATPQAGLSLTGVDQELVLHPALLAPRVPVVVDARASVDQRELERLDDSLHPALAVLRLHRAGRREGAKLRAPERLVRVDVPDPGH